MKSGIWSFVIGFATGIAAALLFAPQSGEETRGLIADTARKGVDRGSRAVRDAAATGAEAIKRGRRQAEEAMESGKVAYSQAASSLE